jgi:hypothetical protein
MKNKLLLLMALALSLAGCKTFEPRPDSPADCSAPGGQAPAPPPVQTVPDTEAVPALPPSTHIVVGYCPATSAYTAMGVDTKAQRFTFLMKGSRASQQQAFRSFYDAGVPVTVYTQRVKLTARTGSTALAPAPPPPSPAPTAVPQPVPQSSGDDTYDPCQTIGEEPPPTPKPTGSNRLPEQFTSFQDLSWHTAHALDAVSAPAPASTLPPVPR